MLIDGNEPEVQEIKQRYSVASDLSCLLQHRSFLFGVSKCHISGYISSLHFFTYFHLLFIFFGHRCINLRINVFWQHELASCSVGTLEAELVAENAAFERAEDALHLAKVQGKEEMLTAATKKFETFLKHFTVDLKWTFDFHQSYVSKFLQMFFLNSCQKSFLTTRFAIAALLSSWWQAEFSQEENQLQDLQALSQREPVKSIAVTAS